MWDSWGEWRRDFRDGFEMLRMGAGTILNATDVGGMVQGMAESLIEEYAANLEDDLEWAMDWSRRDDDYSRMSSRWVDIALAKGLADHFNAGYWAEAFNSNGDGPAMGSGGGVTKKSARKLRKLFGEFHHAISRQVQRALASHPTLNGLLDQNDQKWLTQAATKADHVGWQTWHRDYDKELVQWLSDNPSATLK